MCNKVLFIGGPTLSKNGKINNKEFLKDLVKREGEDNIFVGLLFHTNSLKEIGVKIKDKKPRKIFISEDVKKIEVKMIKRYIENRFSQIEIIISPN